MQNLGGGGGGGNKKHYGLCESSELKIGQEVQYTTTDIPRRNWKQWLCKIWGAEGRKTRSITIYVKVVN